MIEVKGRIYEVKKGHVMSVEIDGIGVFTRMPSPKAEEPKVEPKKTPVKKHKHKPKDAVAYIKNYGIWVKKDDIQKVKTAINKYGFNPTTQNIKIETGMTEFRVLATLKHLVKKGIIKKTRNGDRQTVYQAV